VQAGTDASLLPRAASVNLDFSGGRHDLGLAIGSARMGDYGMGRTLKDVTFIDGVPNFGVCSTCGRTFEVLDTSTNPGQATRDFYTAFENHECDEDARSSESSAVHHLCDCSETLSGVSSSRIEAYYASQTRKSELGQGTTRRDPLAAYRIRRTGPQAGIE
jgi:hypothetical protein